MTSALGAAARVLARVHTGRVISIFLDLIRAYNSVHRRIIYELVRQKYRREVPGMVTQLL